MFSSKPNAIFVFSIKLMLFAASYVMLACDSSSAISDSVEHIYNNTYKDKYKSIKTAKRNLEAFINNNSQHLNKAESEQMRIALGSVYAMEMNYDSAKSCFLDVINNTSNDLHRSMADVEMMSLCLALSMNKDFYDYRADAIERFHNVEEEYDNMTQGQKILWQSVNAKYHFASINYFKRMRMDDEVNEELSWIESNINTISADTILYSKYLLLKSITILDSSYTPDQLTHSLRQLVHLLYMSHQNGLVYFEILASNALAQYMSAGDELKPSLSVLITELLDSDSVHIDDYYESVASLLANHALALSDKYHNCYFSSIVRCTLSNIALHQDEKQAALAHALYALDLINHYHTEHENNERHEMLLPYSDSIESLSTEMILINDPNVEAVPEWMAFVREQLSIVYAAMGMRQESAYNRNIYFDILDATRQDLRVEQEKEHLTDEESKLNILLVLSILAAAAAVIFFIYYRHRLRIAYNRDIRMLRSMLEICERISDAVMSDLDNDIDVDHKLRLLVADDVRSLFPAIGDSDWVDVDCKCLSSLDREMLHVLQMFYRWIINKSLQTAAQHDRLQQIDAETCSFEFKYRTSKRDYIQRATTVSIVNSIPTFLNRAMHEVCKLDDDKSMNLTEMTHRMQYLSELVDSVNAYNDVLGHWIKVRQGMVSLNIENFALQPLFDMVNRNRLSYENKGLNFSVDSTPLAVRGDKSMTLFMINTLLDNARKYTPSGGSVSLSASEVDGMVYVKVSDTGYGLSSHDVDTINGKAVYDSANIGIDSQHASAINKNKGYGFGLMNCKAVIEKLRKTNRMFSLCRFEVSSELGKGSDFFFSLPSKTLRSFLLILSVSLASIAQATVGHLEKASAFADSVYNANVDGDCAKAVVYADSAINHLNEYHKMLYPGDNSMMRLRQGRMSELDWFKKEQPFDYELIVSLRNEVAIASLSLQDYELYKYNNEAFNSLYTLTSTNPSLELYCKSIQQANRNKKTILFLIASIIIVCLFFFLLMHYRHHSLFVFNLRQLMHLGSDVFDTPDALMIKNLRKGLSDIVPMESISLMEISSANDSVPCLLFDGNENKRMVLENIMHSAYSQRSMVKDVSGKIYAFPLILKKSDRNVVVGVLGLCLETASITDDVQLMFGMMVQAVTIYTYYSNYKNKEMLSQIELKEDERQRVEMEQRKVYIRNQIVDNSLSALKHETMYFPSRLKHMIDTTFKDNNGTGLSFNNNASHEMIHEMRILLSYYNDVYSLLSSCAAAQVEKSLFRRSVMTVKDVVCLFEKSFERQSKQRVHLSLCQDDDMPDSSVICDKDFLGLLIDNIATVYFSHHKLYVQMKSVSEMNLAKPSLEVFEQDGFMGFVLNDMSYNYDEEELSKLFFIDGLHYDPTTDTMIGTEYMLCRQIIREHDEHSPRRGCRIYVKNNDVGGSQFVFTLPVAN